MKRFVTWIGFFLVVAGVGAACGDETADAERLLVRWCDGMIAHQLCYPGKKALDGAMVCPACCYLHGRICDAVYAFVVAWRRTGDAKYLKAAVQAVDWTEANMLRKDGFYKNDIQSGWWYTTVFSQISFYKTLTEFGGVLSAETREKWRAIYIRQSDWIYRYFTRQGADPVVNYWGTFAEAMAEAGVYLNEPKYTQAAKESLARIIRDAFTPEGLLKGEGHQLYALSAVRKNAAVDFGYNLEETMPALLAASGLLGDTAAEEVIVRSSLAQLETLLPDGGIDDSMGSRSSKWTYSGSRTSDGVLALLAKLERKGCRWARRAAGRVIALHERMTSEDGLLYGGLHYADADEPACIHHTFTHCKSVAEWLVMTAGRKPDADEPMPRERSPRLVRWPSISTELVAIGPWRATFCASDAYVDEKFARRFSVGGGSPTLLWHERLGPVLAASQYDFFYTESKNQQDQRHDTYVLTSNSRLLSADGRFSNVCDFDVNVSSVMTNGVFEYVAKGRLTDLQGERSVPFEIAYELDQAAYRASIRVEAECRYCFPVLAGRQANVVIDRDVAYVRGPSGCLIVKASSPIRIMETERGERAFTTIGGFMTVQFYVECKPGEKTALEIKEWNP